MKETELTVMFCDICGYTTLSRTLSPADLQPLLDDYLRACSAVIVESGGIIDKVMGDGILALFGVADAKADHAMQAVTAAAAIWRSRTSSARSGKRLAPTAILRSEWASPPARRWSE